MEIIDKMVGYKATDKDMKCLDHQFVLGEWYTVEGELVWCENGFHFCEHPSGPWSYYWQKETRIFKVEAEEVVAPVGTGADTKCVARRIRLVEEIILDGDGDTSHRNIGNRNTGCNNAGHRNTGDYNVGDLNVGRRNAGNRNTGYRNSGSLNIGGCNTGDQNTGYGNAGDQNKGGFNTGSRNIGFNNSGSGNVTNNCPGSFCLKEPNFICFDVDSKMTTKDFMEKFCSVVYDLSHLLRYEDDINYEDFKDLPGCTPEKLRKLHKEYLEGLKQ